MYSIQSPCGYNICLTALQAIMDRMEQMTRSMEQMERSNQQMERSMEELRLENRTAMNIGPEMDQEIDTNVYQSLLYNEQLIIYVCYYHQLPTDYHIM